MSMKNSSNTIGNPTRDLPACSMVPQPTAPRNFNNSKPCPLSTVCSPKATFNIPKVHAAFFPSLKKNLMQTHHSFNSVILYIHKNHTWNNATALFKQEMMTQQTQPSSLSSRSYCQQQQQCLCAASLGTI
jgi:hypothetical protein